MRHPPLPPDCSIPGPSPSAAPALPGRLAGPFQLTASSPPRDKGTADGRPKCQVTTKITEGSTGASRPSAGRKRQESSPAGKRQTLEFESKRNRVLRNVLRIHNYTLKINTTAPTITHSFTTQSRVAYIYIILNYFERAF